MKRILLGTLFLLLICTSVTAQDKSINTLFQEALFQEESEGDLDKAIETYRTILDSAKDDTTSSKEYEETVTKIKYQLGLCYLKKGDKEKAITEFTKIVKTYEGHDGVVNNARNYLKQLSPEYADTNRAIELIPTPWGKQEMLRMKLYAENGGEIGEIIYAVQQGIQNGVEVETLFTYRILPTRLLQEMAVSVYNRSDMMPIHSKARYGARMSWEADYTGDKVVYRSIRDGKKTENTTSKEFPLFDDDQTMFLIRRLPLKVGYKDSAMVFNTMNGIAVKGHLHVTAIEDITIGLGTFNCFKAEVNSTLQGEKNFGQTLWITTDSRRLLVQAKTGKETEKLIAYNADTMYPPQVLSDTTMNIKTSLPTGQILCKSPFTQIYKTVYQIYSPEVLMQSLIITFEDKSDLSNAKFVEKEIRDAKGWWKKYKVRKDSYVESIINGIPVRQHVAEVKYGDRTPSGILEYRTYFFTEKQNHLVVFRSTKDTFKKDKPLFDSLLNTIKLK